MKELELKYGCNPNQVPSRIFSDSGELPIKVLNGKPGYINFLDALNGYQLVRELRETLGLPAAASFKHASPAGTAIGLPLSDAERKSFNAEDIPLTPLACAYTRARGADRVSSYGDWVALSDVCDKETAQKLSTETSDGVIAPGYSGVAFDILSSKRKGTYCIVEIDPAYTPRPIERKDVYGITFEQNRNELKINADMLSNIVTNEKELPDDAVRDMLLALITLKYTQSNSVCYALGGQSIGVGAGQQSRIHCTRLAGSKADKWWLRQYPKVLELPFRHDIKPPNRDTTIDIYLSDESDDILAEETWPTLFTKKPEPLTDGEKKDWISKMRGVSLGSDAFFPFPDNIDRARKSGVSYIAQPGGSIRDDSVIEVCDRHGIMMAFTGIRLFHH